MKSIVLTYPYFHSLPKGIKMMLVASESFFFDDFKAGSTPVAESPASAAAGPAKAAAVSAPAVIPFAVIRHAQPALTGRRLSDTQIWWRN